MELGCIHFFLSWYAASPLEAHLALDQFQAVPGWVVVSGSIQADFSAVLTSELELVCFTWVGDAWCASHFPHLSSTISKMIHFFLCKLFKFCFPVIFTALLFCWMRCVALTSPLGDDNKTYSMSLCRVRTFHLYAM